MIQTDIPCSWPGCGQPLIEILLGRHYVRMCDQLGCPKYRERQGIREKNIGFGNITEFLPAPLLDTLSLKGLSSLPRDQIGKKRKGKKGRVK